MTRAALLQCLAEVPPFEPQGVQLLRQLRPQTGEWFPAALPDASTSQVIEATVEIIGYTQRCADAIRKLAQLGPVPLDLPLVEFAL